MAEDEKPVTETPPETPPVTPPETPPTPPETPTPKDEDKEPVTRGEFKSLSQLVEGIAEALKPEMPGPDEIVEDKTPVRRPWHKRGFFSND